jgi:hypothetical protein
VKSFVEHEPHFTMEHQLDALMALLAVGSSKGDKEALALEVELRMRYKASSVDQALPAG